MLICPECKYENSEQNKFCENCGTSLTHRNCHQCDTKIPITAQKCEVCGADNATRLLALIVQGNSDQVSDSQEQELLSTSTASTADDLASENSIPTTPENDASHSQNLLIQKYAGYLDVQNRYYALEDEQPLSNIVPPSS